MTKSQSPQKRSRTEHRYDHLQAARTQATAFNAGWLRNGESLSVFRRIGFTIFSVLFVGLGLYLGHFALQSVRDGDFMIVIFGPASLGFLIIGLLGLRNVLRFRRNESKQ